MESGSKIVSASVSTEPTCELAASSSQNSLPGGSFMEVATDILVLVQIIAPSMYVLKRLIFCSNYVGDHYQYINEKNLKIFANLDTIAVE